MLTADPQTYDWSRPTVDHVHLRVSDLPAARAFYGALLEPLEIPLLLDLPHLVGFGNLALSADGPTTTGAHIAFVARSKEAVDAFHAAGLAALLVAQGVRSPAAVEGALRRFARDAGAAGRDPEFGDGIIDARATLRGLGLAK